MRRLTSDPVRLTILTGFVSLVYVAVAVASVAAAHVIVVPCIAVIVVPAIRHNVERERVRRDECDRRAHRSSRSRATVGE